MKQLEEKLAAVEKDDMVSVGFFFFFCLTKIIRELQLDLELILKRLMSLWRCVLRFISPHTYILFALQRHWFRNFLMWGFHLLVATLCVKSVIASSSSSPPSPPSSSASPLPQGHSRHPMWLQALHSQGGRLPLSEHARRTMGFWRRALVRRAMARYVILQPFNVAMLLDLHCSYRSSLSSPRIPIVEVPVNWQEIEGSKLSPVAASIQIGRDMLRIRANYLIGWWRLDYPSKQISK